MSLTLKARALQLIGSYQTHSLAQLNGTAKFENTQTRETWEQRRDELAKMDNDPAHDLDPREFWVKSRPQGCEITTSHYGRSHVTEEISAPGSFTIKSARFYGKHMILLSSRVVEGMGEELTAEKVAPDNTSTVDTWFTRY